MQLVYNSNLQRVFTALVDLVHILYTNGVQSSNVQCTGV